MSELIEEAQAPESPQGVGQVRDCAGRSHFGSSQFSLERCIAHACVEFTTFVIPSETIFNGSHGMERRLNTGRLVRGHPGPRPPSVQWPGTGQEGKIPEVPQVPVVRGNR